MRGGNFGAFPTWEIAVALVLVVLTLGIIYTVNEAIQYVS